MIFYESGHNGGILDLPQIIIMVNNTTNDGPANIVENNYPTFNNIFEDGSDRGPAPLQNNVNATEWYEIVVDAFNASIVVNDDITNASSQLQIPVENLRLGVKDDILMQERMYVPVVSPKSTTDNIQ